MNRLPIILACAAASLVQALPGGAMPAPHTAETATFAGGCFWCLDEVFRQQVGVLKVTSGYTGGETRNPTYREVCAGDTGHAEAVQIVFNPQRISYNTLLQVFWKTHDPTQFNRQGADIGTQYRSAIFIHSDAQATAARASLAAEDQSGRHAGRVVTEIAPAGEFYPAEEYHQGYYRNNRQAPYCRAVIQPKLKKLGLAD